MNELTITEAEFIRSGSTTFRQTNLAFFAAGLSPSSPCTTCSRSCRNSPGNSAFRQRLPASPFR